MKRSKAIELCLEHVECDGLDDFMEQLTYSEIHNVAICLGCENTFDIEPDASSGESPCCPGKRYVTLTKLFNIDL